MTKGKTYTTRVITPEPIVEKKRKFSFPTLGVVVEATNLSEALELAKKLINK